jgi:hypothetical protein
MAPDCLRAAWERCRGGEILQRPAGRVGPNTPTCCRIEVGMGIGAIRRRPCNRDRDRDAPRNRDQRAGRGEGLAQRAEGGAGPGEGAGGTGSRGCCLEGSAGGMEDGASEHATPSRLTRPSGKPGAGVNPRGQIRWRTDPSSGFCHLLRLARHRGMECFRRRSVGGKGCCAVWRCRPARLPRRRLGAGEAGSGPRMLGAKVRGHHGAHCGSLTASPTDGGDMVGYFAELRKTSDRSRSFR